MTAPPLNPGETVNDVTVKIRVKSPPCEIWKIWSNFSEAPLWDTDVSHCELAGLFQPGTRGQCILKNGLRMPLTIEAVTLHESYRNTAKLLWINLEFDHRMHRLSPQETEVIHSAKLCGPLSFLYRGPLRKMLTAVMATALDNLRALAEQRTNAQTHPGHELSATYLE